jgi:hypothetical protein
MHMPLSIGHLRDVTGIYSTGNPGIFRLLKQTFVTSLPLVLSVRYEKQKKVMLLHCAANEKLISEHASNYCLFCNISNG